MLKKKGGHDEYSWILPACRDLPTRQSCSALGLSWSGDRQGVLPWSIAWLSYDMS